MDALSVQQDSQTERNGSERQDCANQAAECLREDTKAKSQAALEPAAVASSDKPESELAKFPHNVWIQFGGVSHHFDRDRDFNEKNFGIGVEYEFNRDLSLAVGQYRNSIRNTSHYAALAYTPLHAGPFSFGVAAGTIDGYYFNNGGFFPMAMPMATYETKHFGVNALYVPKVKDVSSVVGVQFKVRF